MRRGVLYIFAFWLLMPGCTSKQKKDAVVGSVKDTTQIDIIANYELVDCRLVYTKALSKDYSGTEVTMKTEYKSYPPDIWYLSIYVYNPTDTALEFGRSWLIETWNGNKWGSPKMKKELFLFSDGFFIQKTHIVYCFKYPIGEYYILPKGKYRIIKTFHQDTEEIQLNAEFEIK